MLSDKTNTAPLGTVSTDRLTRVSGSFTVGAAGAITANDSAKAAGGTPVKTATKTARYTVSLYRPFTRIVPGCSMTGPTDAAFGNTAGNTVQHRNVIANTANSAAVAQFDIQAFLASSGADTDVPSGTIINWWADCYAK